MQIAFIHPSWPAAEGTGATHSATQIAVHLSQIGHDVTVFGTKGETSDAETDFEFTTEPIPLDDTVFSHPGIQRNRFLRDHGSELGRYDIVHSYVMDCIPALGEISRTTTAATVATLNAYRGVCPKNDLRFFDQKPCHENGQLRCAACISSSNFTSKRYAEDSRPYGWARAIYDSVHQYRRFGLIRNGRHEREHLDGFHALSPHVKSTYVEFGFPAERISVIPNILDEHFCIEHTSDFTEPYQLLYVGYLKRHKGVEKLIPILNRLNEKSEASFELTIVGDGELRQTLEEDVRRQGLSDAVTLAGHVPYEELPKWYASHDIFVYPGVWDEPFGRVFIEALAAGTPVVSSDVGSIRKIVGNGGIVTDGSVDSFSNAIDSLVSSPNGIEEQSTAATVRANEYRASKVIKSIEKLYEKISTN